MTKCIQQDDETKSLVPEIGLEVIGHDEQNYQRQGELRRVVLVLFDGA